MSFLAIVWNSHTQLQTEAVLRSPRELKNVLYTLSLPFMASKVIPLFSWGLSSKNPCDKWKLTNNWQHPPQNVWVFFLFFLPLCKKLWLGAIFCTSLNIMLCGSKTYPRCQTLLMLLSVDDSKWYSSVSTLEHFKLTRFITKIQIS